MWSAWKFPLTTIDRRKSHLRYPGVRIIWPWFRRITLLIRMVLPAVRKIYLWLRTCRTKVGQITNFRSFHIVAKAVPFPDLKITPLPWYPPKFTFTVLSASQKSFLCLKQYIELTGTVWGNALFVRQHNFLIKLAAAGLHSMGINVEVF
jgi:hypothetical protein